jgi:hypothetical protein
VITTDMSRNGRAVSIIRVFRPRANSLIYKKTLFCYGFSPTEDLVEYTQLKGGSCVKKI